MNLSKNFTLNEFVFSPTAIRCRIDNTPNSDSIANMKLLCENVIQVIRDKFGVVRISSGFRCPKLNSRVKGSGTSQHVYGQAADITLENMKEVFKYIQDNLEFDQLIWEYGTDESPAWIHVSYSKDRNRKEVLRKYKIGPYKKFKI